MRKFEVIFMVIIRALPRRTMVLTGVFFVLISCVSQTTPEQRQVEYAKKHMIGMSRAAVVGCAGEPQRTKLKDKGRSEVLIYRVEFFQKRKHTGTELRDCEAHFLIEIGHVSTINYKGNTGGSVWNQQQICAPIIQKCVDHVKG